MKVLIKKHYVKKKTGTFKKALLYFRQKRWRGRRSDRSCHVTSSVWHLHRKPRCRKGFWNLSLKSVGNFLKLPCSSLKKGDSKGWSENWFEQKPESVPLCIPGDVLHVSSLHQDSLEADRFLSGESYSCPIRFEKENHHLFYFFFLHSFIEKHRQLHQVCVCIPFFVLIILWNLEPFRVWQICRNKGNQWGANILKIHNTFCPGVICLVMELRIRFKTQNRCLWTLTGQMVKQLVFGGNLFWDQSLPTN